MRSMNQKYKLSKLAESDLTGIWRYTAETWSQDQANRYVKMIMDAFNEIAKSPAVLGRSYEHVRQGYRKYTIGKHVVFYQLTADGGAMISRILHEKMDYDRHL